MNNFYFECHIIYMSKFVDRNCLYVITHQKNTYQKLPALYPYETNQWNENRCSHSCTQPLKLFKPRAKECVHPSCINYTRKWHLIYKKSNLKSFVPSKVIN